MLFAGEPRWSPPLRSYETWLVSRRHPYRRATGAALDRWLVRRGGRVIGRVAAHHVEGDETAWFGGFECDDDAEAVAALLDAVSAWASERGAIVLRGPALYTPDDGDAGMLVDGFEHAGGTARPWHPPWYVTHLAAAGLEYAGDPLPRWRLAASGTPSLTSGGPVPPHAGRLADPALVLHGPAGDGAAVPDVTAAARATSLRRPPRATEASIVRCEGDPAVLVPALLAAASAGGYEAVWSPWCPDPGRPPETTYRLLQMVADRNQPT